MNILSVNNLCRMGREEPLFEGVTFGLDEGDKASLIGKNGTGKSTMLNTIAGLLPCDEGTVVINKSAGLSFLPQNPSFEANDTIRSHIFKSDSPKLKIIQEYLDVCAKLGNSTSESVQKEYDLLNQKMEQMDLWNYESQVSSILSTLGISDMSRKMGELSGGMVKKVALAQVLVEDTKLLLLDEPSMGLAPILVDEIFEIIKKISSAGTTILLVEQNAYKALSIANRAYILETGEITKDGKASDLITDKAVISAYLGG